LRGCSTMADAAQDDDVSHGFFTFDPRLLLADVRNSVEDYIADASDAIEAALLEECAGGDGSVPAAVAAEIHEGTDELNAQLVERFSQKYNILGDYAARNIFNVDEEIAVLAAQEGGGGGDGGGGDADVTEEEEQQVDANFKQLQLKLEKARKEAADLQARHEQINALDATFDKHKHDVAQIKVRSCVAQSIDCRCRQLVLQGRGVGWEVGVGGPTAVARPLFCCSVRLVPSESTGHTFLIAISIALLAAATIIDVTIAGVFFFWDDFLFLLFHHRPCSGPAAAAGGRASRWTSSSWAARRPSSRGSRPSRPSCTHSWWRRLPGRRGLRGGCVREER
jgi:hypothetical protein